jgi:hypothetical protein
MIDNEQARRLLERGLLSYLFEVLWRSALLTAILKLIDYWSRPKAFAWEDVWITFAIITIVLAFMTFLGLAMAAFRYRHRSKDKGES